MKNVMYLLLITVFLCCSNNNDSDTVEDPGNGNETFLLEEGNYKGLWNSTATNGSVYTDLKITATIKKVSKTEYSGSLFISENYTSCCNTSGNNGDGPITIKIENGKVTFKWVDQIPNCTGEFVATGNHTQNNRLKLKLTGNDCEGDHSGEIEFFK
ncbi:hypothetical protein [Tenacibaculum agarivorans]|uniref:hypothetical protein n=1 Tax=Tenacibaculum agarivorans TaxID=1908389 RepID=UPI00094BA4F9|nr:hypothetical protein [Tenacibaculum agarivorans]